MQPTQTNTALRLLLQGFLGVILLGQTACSNQRSMNMDGRGGQLESNEGQPANSPPAGERAIPEALIEGMKLHPNLPHGLVRYLPAFKDGLREVTTTGYDFFKAPVKFWIEQEKRSKSKDAFFFSHSTSVFLLTAAVILLDNATPVLEALIKAGANKDYLDATAYKIRQPALYFAIFHRNFSAAEWLLDHGADASLLDHILVNGEEQENSVSHCRACEGSWFESSEFSETRLAHALLNDPRSKDDPFNGIAKTIIYAPELTLDDKRRIWGKLLKNGLKIYPVADKDICNPPDNLLHEASSIPELNFLLEFPAMHSLLYRENGFGHTPFENVLALIQDGYLGSESPQNFPLDEQIKRMEVYIDAIPSVDFMTKKTMRHDGTEGPTLWERLRYVIQNNGYMLYQNHWNRNNKRMRWEPYNDQMALCSSYRSTTNDHRKLEKLWRMSRPFSGNPIPDKSEKNGRVAVLLERLNAIIRKKIVPYSALVGAHPLHDTGCVGSELTGAQLSPELAQLLIEIELETKNKPIQEERGT